MAVVIRMSRGGRRNLPFYRIVVADSRFPRDGRYIERVGTYNPLLETGNENRVTLVKDRIEHWLKQGAKPSERVAMFLGQDGMIDMPKQSNRPEKSAPGEKAKSRLEEKAAKKAAAEEAAKAPKEAPAPAPEAAPAEAPAEAANEAAPPAEEAAAG